MKGKLCITCILLLSAMFFEFAFPPLLVILLQEHRYNELTYLKEEVPLPPPPPHIYLCIAVYQRAGIVPLLFLRPRTVDGISHNLIVRRPRTIVPPFEDHRSHEISLCSVRNCHRTYRYTPPPQKKKHTHTYIWRV